MKPAKPKHPDYCSVERVRFSHNKLTGQVQARIKLVGKALSAGLPTGISCTLNEFKKGHLSNPKPATAAMELHQELIKWNHSILRTAYNLTQAGQTVTAERLLEGRNLMPDEFPQLDDSTSLSFQYLFAVRAAGDEGEITARFRIGGRITPNPLPIGVRCSAQDWQVFSELRVCPESEQLSASLTAYQNAILNAARLFQRSGADLNPEYVHTAAMGPHRNGLYAHA